MLRELKKRTLTEVTGCHETPMILPYFHSLSLLSLVVTFVSLVIPAQHSRFRPEVSLVNCLLCYSG